MSPAEPVGPRDDAAARAAALRASLAAAGLFAGDVEAAGALALLRPSPGTRAPDRAARLALTRLGREHGFTHLALEIPASATVEARALAADAPLPRG